MALKITNNATSITVGALSSSDTTLSITAGTGALFPILGTGDYFYATLTSVLGNYEIVKVTARTDDTFTVVRGQEGTLAIPFPSASRFESRVTAKTLLDSIQETVSITGFGASTSNTAAQNAAAINAAIAASSSIYIPAGTYLTNQITLKSGLTIYGDGAVSVLQAPAGQTLLYGVSSGAGAYLENVTIRSLRLLGAVAASGFSEFIHLLNVNGVRNMLVDSVQFVGFQGDGMYLGAHSDNTRHNATVTISNCVFDGVNKDNRNALSVIDCDTLLVRNNVFKNASRSNMPGFVDVEPNDAANIIRKIQVTGNSFENTDCSSAAISILVVTPTLTVAPETFVVSNNTFNINRRMVSFRINATYTPKHNLIVTGNTGVVSTFGDYYPKINGATISNNTLTVTDFAVLGIANTDTINNLVISGNTFNGGGTANRAFSLRSGSGHAITGNVFSNFSTYGFLCGIAGGTLSNTSITGNTFVSCGTYAVGSSGGIDGVSCSFLGNTHNITHQFPAWRTDDTGNITNGDTSPTTFNADNLPSAFTYEGIYRSAINGDTAVPNTGGYQGLLETHCETGQNGTKWKYQLYYPANNTRSITSFYVRKGGTSTDVWTTWSQHSASGPLNVMDFGAVGDGVANDTAAINAAITALSATGGEIYFPSGKYACNITITKSGVTLRGAGLCDWRTAANFHGLIPFNAANPVITVGNDTGYVTGTRLENLSIASPDGLGMCGLRLAGGTYGFQAEGIHIVGFKKYCVWAQNGATYPVTYTHFNNFTFSTGPTASMDPAASAVFAYYATGAATAFTTGLFFENGQVVFRTFGARAFWMDGAQVYATNVYIEAGGTTRQGLKYAKTYASAQAPLFFGDNVTIDGDTGVGIVLEGHIESPYTPNFVRGKVNLDGLLETLSGVTVDVGGLGSHEFYPELLYPTVQGAMLFPDPSNFLDNTAQIFGSSTAGARRLNLQGDRIDMTHGSLGARILSQATSNIARLFMVDAQNSRTTEVRNSAGELQLWAPAGYGVRVGDGAWNGNPTKLGAYHLWVDSTGRLRIKSSVPTSDTDGTVVGTQT
jgi:hypothetical protein